MKNATMTTHVMTTLMITAMMKPSDPAMAAYRSRPAWQGRGMGDLRARAATGTPAMM
jgi:hypothetical protein